MKNYLKLCIPTAAFTLMTVSCKDIQNSIDSAVEKAIDESIESEGSVEFQEPFKKAPVVVDEATRLANLRADHTNAVVKVFSFSFGGEDTIFDRYKSWVKDWENGPTGKEMMILGIQKLSNLETKLDKLDKVISKSAYPILSEKAKVYRSALVELEPIVNEANKYYKQEDYKDDGMKKGKELHQKLRPLIDEVVKSKNALKGELAKIQNIQLLEDIELDKKEGRDVAYRIRKTLQLSKSFNDICLEVPSAELDIEKLQKIYDEMEEKYLGLNEHLEKLESFSKRQLEEFIDDAEECCTEAKKLIRSVKAKESAKDVNERINSFISESNSLVRSYNNLNSSKEIMGH